MDKQPPTTTEAAEADRKARHEREAAALRSNLQRRKAHLRSRSGDLNQTLTSAEKAEKDQKM